MEKNTIRTVRPLLGALLTVGLLLLGVLAAVTMFTGCVKRELETRPDVPQEGTVEIAFTWPDGEEPPTGARLLFYNEDGTFHREHGDLTDSYRGTLPAGNYRLILHNNDAEQVGYGAMESHGTAEVYVLNISGETPSTQGELLAQPRKVYGVGRHDQGEHFSITGGETLQLSVAAERLTREVHFYFAVTGLDAVQSVAGTLRGVAPSVLLCTRECRQVSFGQAFDTEAYTPQPTAQTPTAHGAQAAKTANAPKAAIRFRTSMELIDLLTRKESPAGTNSIEAVVTDGDGRPYPVQVDITAALQQVIEENEGELPVEVPLTVSIEVNPVTAEVNATVTPWDETGTGGGDFE